MKKLGIFAVAMLIGLTTTFAQSKTTPVKDGKHSQDIKRQNQRSERGVTQLDQTVNLSEDQKVEIQKINKESSEKMRAVRVSYKDKEDKTGMKEEIKVIQDARKMKVHNSLTPEQKKKLKESKASKEKK